MDPTTEGIPPSQRADPIANALRFVAEATIPAPRVRRGDALRGDTRDTVADSFKTAKDQAAVVGPEVISFVSGVTPERREAIVNSSLLAQLYANTKVSDRDNIDDWYQAYFYALTKLGWVIQENNLVQYHEGSDDFEAHRAILAVATTLLGPASTALAIVTSTINALGSINEGTPWFTIFHRESQAARTARFQIGLASQETDGQFFVSLMAFGLQARAKVTQVLFFRAKSSEATLRHRSSRITINTTVLDAASGPMKQKLIGQAEDFVRTLPDFA